MSTEHYVMLRVDLRCEEMDGSPYETAEIMLELVEKVLKGSLACTVNVEVPEYGEVTA